MVKQSATLDMITPSDASALVEKDPQVKLVDVRSVLEFNEVHIKDSINIPIDALPAKINELSQAKQSYILLCRTGKRSAMAAEMLTQAGILGVKVMQGGITRWRKEKLPVIKGEVTISLERQVRIIAGSLMLSGIILFWFVSWLFIFLSIFVACGLIFAGITDNCMMGTLLMKLPYNQKLYKTKSGAGTC